jgi:hypothetical protein
MRPQIERFFFAERHSLERGVERLLRDLPACADTRQILMLLGEQLDFSLRPKSCIVYGRSEETYAPPFFFADALSPRPSASSRSWSKCSGPRVDPVEVERWLRCPKFCFPSAERAVLDSLGAAILVPMLQSNAMAATLCLGPNRSGDIYTTT